MAAPNVIEQALRDAYLARLGLEAEPPSSDALARIHRAHVERVPYETLWIHMGDRWSTDPHQAVTRVATQGRGGYCFHLNGALAELLQALGYDVVRHVGGVHGPAGPTDEEMANHLVLTVHGLPTEENPGGAWYVDAGLGDALHDPLPLVAGTYQQGPWSLVLAETPGALGDWHLDHDPSGGFTGMAWLSAPAPPAAFDRQHEWLSTSAESGFVKVLTAQVRDATGVTVLRGLVLKRIGEWAAESVIESKQDFAAVLSDLFALDLGRLDAAAADELWTRLRQGHEAWEAAGRP